MTDDTHIYYDISIFNNDISGDMPVNLKFSEQRSGGALIENPQDYYLSIVRFEIDSPSLPIFIPQRRLGSSSFNDLIYIFGLEVIKGATNTPTARYKKEFNLFLSILTFQPTNSTHMYQQTKNIR